MTSWPIQIAVHKVFVKSLICNQCHRIPKIGHGVTCGNGHIFCETCIKLLIQQKSLCVVDNKIITKYELLPKVLQHMTNELDVCCPNSLNTSNTSKNKCKWTAKLSNLSQHIKQCNANHNKLIRKHSENDLSKNSKKKHFNARKRSSSITSLNKINSIPPIKCPLLSLGCGYTVNNNNNTNLMDNHFNEYNMKHSMMIINEFNQKCQKLENSVQFLQSQMKFVLNELNLANKTINNQAKQILVLMQQNGDKSTYNPISQNKPSLLTQKLQTNTEKTQIVVDHDDNKVKDDQDDDDDDIDHDFVTISPTKLSNDDKPNVFTGIGSPITISSSVSSLIITSSPASIGLYLNNRKRIIPRFHMRSISKKKKSIDTIASKKQIITQKNTKLNNNKSNKIVVKNVDKSDKSVDKNVNKNVEQKLNTNDIILSDFSAVIIDNGSGFIKYGYGNNDSPSSFLTLIGDNKYNNNNNSKYIGDKITFNDKFVSNIHSPIKSGIIENWDEMESIWWYIFNNKLKVNPSTDLDVIIMNESLMNDTNNRENLTQIMFEQFDIKSFYLSPDVVLSLNASGKLTGTIIESGYDHTTISPMYEGIPLKMNSININNISGNIVNKWLYNNITSLSLNNIYNSKISYYKKDYIINDIKHKYCCVNNGNGNSKQSQSISYSLPDSYTLIDDLGDIISSIWLNAEIYNCTEKTIMNKLPDLLYSSINGCFGDIKNVLYDNIILSGGNTMFNGINKRLKNELLIKSKSNNINFNSNINILSNNLKIRGYQSWKGGAILSTVDAIKEMAISKQEYHEFGPQIVRHKCT